MENKSTSFLKDNRGYMDFNLLVLIFTVLVLISFIIAFESWRSKQIMSYATYPSVRETTVEIDNRTHETEQWLGEAVNRCLASSDCELERDGSRVVFQGIDADVIASDVPDGVRIIHSEKKVYPSNWNPADDFSFEWIKFGLPIVLLGAALLVVLINRS